MIVHTKDQMQCPLLISHSPNSGDSVKISTSFPAAFQSTVLDCLLAIPSAGSAAEHDPALYIIDNKTNNEENQLATPSVSMLIRVYTEECTMRITREMDLDPRSNIRNGYFSYAEQVYTCPHS